MAASVADKKLNSLAIAESRAQDLIKKATERKAKLIEEAAVTAEKEIQVRREKYQKEFDAKKYDITEEEKKQAEVTSKEIAEVYKQYEANNKVAIEYMLDNILRVDLAVSRNVKADFSSL